MAGGPNAKAVMCWHCTGKANRTYDGSETDYYKCEECNTEFGIDWRHRGQPDRPCWPPSPEEQAAAKKLAEKRAKPNREQST
jgi:hypothetical protein